MTQALSRHALRLGWIVAGALGLHVAQAESRVDLSGTWQFAMDREEVGIEQKWYSRRTLGDEIALPGSMAERLKGDLPSLTTDWTCSIYDSSYYFDPRMAPYREEGNISLPFCLTPQRTYKGVAWYVREVAVPKDWAGQTVTLELERPHIKTTLWVNGTEVGSQNSLVAPHVYDVTAALKPGKTNLLAVRIDNTNRDTPVGKDSHSVTDQTQGNWNGVVGVMALVARPAVHLADEPGPDVPIDSRDYWTTAAGHAAVEVTPSVGTKSAKVRLALWNRGKKPAGVEVRLRAESYNAPDGRVTRAEAQQSVTVMARPDEPTVANLELEGLTQLWDEFSPTLYRLTVDVVSGGKTIDSREVSFGMREVAVDGRWITVNGRKTLLRGTVENCDFPLTGYAPMDVAAWRRVFETCRAWGLNHMRFHSYCPPEAAFTAADEVGFYLQPEGPSWPNHGVSLGRREPIDVFLLEETKRIVRAYGNHASFTMLSAGNEPRGNWVPWASAFVNYWRERDARRLYTGFSVGGGWAWQPANEYHVKAGARGLDWRRQPGTWDDFASKIDTVRQPFVCHELGQWCAFPDFKEIGKYTGVMQARNFGIFRDILQQNDMGQLAEPFLYASGRLQTICYKYEIEKLLRTPDYAGFQLLALNDYSGQGTALEGVLNVFFEPKGYVEAEEWRQWCSPVVPLIRTERFVHGYGDTVRYRIEIANYGATELVGTHIRTRLTDAEGRELRTNYFPKKNWGAFDPLPIGLSHPASSSFLPANLGLEGPQRVTLHVDVVTAAADSLVATNSWHFWLYPDAPAMDEAGIYVCDSLDERARQVLADGGDVLITAGANVSYGRDVKQQWTPVFWNTSWFKMRPPHTTGIYLDTTHPLFSRFPTEGHSDVQWFELLDRTPVMLFTDFPQGFQPVVQSIDTWFLSRKIGVLFEARVGRGRLLMTTMNLHSDLGRRVVARQMRSAILDYMHSPDFRPAYEVDVERVADLFTKVAPPVDSYTVESPDELKPGYQKPKN